MYGKKGKKDPLDLIIRGIVVVAVVALLGVLIFGIMISRSGTGGYSNLRGGGSAFSLGVD